MNRMTGFDCAVCHEGRDFPAPDDDAGQREMASFAREHAVRCWGYRPDQRLEFLGERDGVVLGVPIPEWLRDA